MATRALAEDGHVLAQGQAWECVRGHSGLVVVDKRTMPVYVPVCATCGGRMKRVGTA